MKKYEFDDIRTQVNRLDEKYGCILTDSKYFSDPEFEFHNAANDMQLYLNSVIRALNGVRLDTDIRGVIHMSKLGWIDHRPYDMDTSIYRCRFLTLLLTELSANIERVCQRMFRYQSPGVGIYEHGYFYLLEIRNTVKEFMDKFLTGNSWREEILKILEISYFLRINKKVRMENLIDGSRTLISELRDGCYHTPFTKPLLDTDMQVDYVLKLAVLICTQTGRCSNVPEMKSYKDKVPGRDSFRYEVAYIGKSIMMEPGDFRKTNLLFQIFWDSMPLTKYGFDGLEENPYLQMGCKALEFVGFILDDGCCSDLIDKLLDREGWS